MMLILYPFRYRDPVSGKWMRARYVAERHEIAAQHTEWEITGPPEIRDVNADARYFHPYPLVPLAELKRLQEPSPRISPHLEQPPAIDAAERFLVSAVRDLLRAADASSRCRQRRGSIERLPPTP
jgi:hypothetical protein